MNQIILSCTLNNQVPYSFSSSVPFSCDKRAETIASMFNNIAYRYDFLNRALSFHMDIWWRKTAIRTAEKLLKGKQQVRILDVATGTADLAIAAAYLQPIELIGIDIAKEMLAIGREKIKKQQLQDMIHLQEANVENLPFSANSFDLVMVAFGVRNFENVEEGLKSMRRVLNRGGALVMVEFSQPQHFLLKRIYRLYSELVLPRVGRLISKDVRAYSYLPHSVKEFPFGSQMQSILESLQWKDVTFTPLTFGICTIYTATK